MYISLLPASLLISLVAAQSTTLSVAGASSACAGQPVLEACLASTQAIANACATTDYGCLCSKWGDVLQCFNECPNDARYSSVLSSQQTYCNDASVYTSSTSTPISRAVSSVAAATTTAASATTTGESGAVQVASSTSASASQTGKSGAGSNYAVGAGQVVLGLAGVVGIFL